MVPNKTKGTKQRKSSLVLTPRWIPFFLCKVAKFVLRLSTFPLFTRQQREPGNEDTKKYGLKDRRKVLKVSSFSSLTWNLALFVCLFYQLNEFNFFFCRSNSGWRLIFMLATSEMKQIQNAVIENVRNTKVIGSSHLNQASLIKFISSLLFVQSLEPVLPEIYWDLHETKSS